MKANCEYCMNYYYDEEYECMCCAINLDQDELASFMADRFDDCPYFRMGDESTIVRKQN